MSPSQHMMQTWPTTCEKRWNCAMPCGPSPCRHLPHRSVVMGMTMPPALMPLLYNPPEHLLLITRLMNKPNGFPVRVFWPAPEQVRRVKSQLLHPPKKKHEPTRALNRRRSTTICWVPTLASCTSQERSRTSPDYHMLFAQLSEPNLS
jgi:hypothetical protein